ncbi:MAG: peptidoglycan DD-metalloendopeptidase family protein [Patescibacteria group bacterium]
MKRYGAFTLPFQNSLTRNRFFVSCFFILYTLYSILFAVPVPVHADVVSELQSKITERTEQLAALEAEIAKYEAELTKVGADRKTLEAEIARLDLSRKKIATDIAVTENRIATTGLQLEEIGTEIEDKERRIVESNNVIQKSLRLISKIDDTTLIEHFLAGANFSLAWEESDRLRRVQTALSDEVVELTAIRESLQIDYTELAKKQGQLVSFKKELTGQKTVLDQNKKAQSTVLGATKSKETEYQKLLNEKKTAREQLESEIRDFEAQLEYTLDPSKIPAAGSGVLSFPLDEKFMSRCADRKSTFGNLYCLTQYFGNTTFAKSGAYNGSGHNGIDFGAPEGTKVISSLSGIVEATGNTDEIKGCYSYGKWVLVRHANGLSSLYAHLSHISISQGEAVATGGLLGYSGNTGYSTGPHLHFTVLASDAVQIVRLGDLKTKTNCANARIPVAGTSGYLNPLSYL